MAATAPTTQRRVGAAAGAAFRRGLERPPNRRPADPARLVPLAGLGVATLYAAFASGAASYPEQARLEVGLALLAVATIGLLALRPGPRVAAPSPAWIALGLLAAFAAWCGLSLAWSVAPSDTWTELNRAIAYALVLGLALVAGSWYPRAVRWAALGYAAVVGLVAVYALGGKVAPALQVGPLDLDQTGLISRLREPLEYWNALGLLVAMAIPVVLRLAADETRPRGVRLGALVALPVYLVTLGLTYSRGGLIALAVALAVTLALAGAGLRSLMYLGIAAAASLPALAVAFTADDLTASFVPLSQREDDGVALGLVLAGSLVLLAVAGLAALAAEPRVAPSRARSRAIVRGLLAALGAALLVGLVAMALSGRGLTGTVSHEWDSFRSSRQAPGQLTPGRLASTNAGNRWVWWSEAAGAWWDRPLAGWGAGSFPVLHHRYRDNRLDVLQPHSVPLQFLSETGLVGLGLAGGAIALLLVGAAGAVRRLAPGPERGLAAALLGASAAWAVHCLYDWDWDFPAVTLPAIAMLGLLCARVETRRSAGWSAARLGTGARAAVLAAATLVLATVAISSVLPLWARTKTDAALEAVARDATPARLARAQDDADHAAGLDPLAHEPLLAASSIAARRGRRAQAREYLMDAIRRAPDSVAVWLAVARFEVRRGDARNVLTALRRVLELDPRNRAAPSVLAAVQYTTVPAGDSATATGTPLVAR